MINKERWNLHISVFIKKDVRVLAAQSGLTESQIVEKAISEYLVKKEKENK